MFNIYKASVLRLIKNLPFIIGCLIAIGATYFITDTGLKLEFIENLSHEERMFFASAAMALYFSFFTTIFVPVEYADGVIRNRIISGFSQKQIYFAHLFTQYTAVLIMHVFYLAGGLLGGARFTGKGMLKVLVFFISLLAYVTITNLIAFRVKKVIVSTIITMVMFNGCFNLVMFGNVILSFVLDDKYFKVGEIIYNLNILGQWFSNTRYAESFVNPGSGIQLIESASILILIAILRSIGLKKRELK